MEYDVVENSTIYNPVDNIDIDIRLRYPTKCRCNDGHYVRSKNEVIVDNWLFNNNIAHAYEKKLLGINILCDFQIINKNHKEVYIEIWGLTDDTYLKRKGRNLQKK
ncbi:MAG: hypothetical protein IT280_11770 [Ignavibacteria bacterium]|nr:hypothetical protein [Ignavibacteria bacterium]